MGSSFTSRRHFLQNAASLAVTGLAAPYFFTAQGAVAADKPRSKNDRHTIGCIGNGGMGHGDAAAASRYGDIVAFCDVDRSHAEGLRKHLKVPKAAIYEDYRKLLDRKDIDVVTISTPDHWHSRIAIAAMKAGKDVYCQKPLTLTIDEGRKILAVLKETGRVFQVGTQQRSEDREMFLKAVALAQTGRLGKIERVTCAIGGAPAGGPFPKTAPPAGLNWNLWLGQAPVVDYIKERSHSTFRWWYEYSGGKLTDWGAHHVDIAQWAIGMDHSGPIAIEPASAAFPQPMKNGLPTKDDCYSTVTHFIVKAQYANGVELRIVDSEGQRLWKDVRWSDNGLLIEGEKGKIFVSRSGFVGDAVNDLKTNPLPQEVLTKLRKGKPSNSHMGNFMACVKDRSTPISDVASHHRAITVCHLANIAMRLGRKLTWDPDAEQIVGDSEANAWQARTQRKGFEVDGV
jgi:predicted dehydrogenase